MKKPNKSSGSKQSNFLEALQAAVLKRYARPYGALEPVIYEFTQDRAMIHQYHVLLETMYRRTFNVPNYKADQDIYDKISHVLIARRGKLCLGGCRLTVREPDETWDLPLESKGFHLRKIFSDLPLDTDRHGEISRFAIMEDSGEEDIFYGLCQVMYEKVISLEIRHLFAKSTYKLARNWRLLANSFGVKTTKICEDIRVPEHPLIPDHEWYITVSDLSKLYPEKSQPQLPPRPEHAVLGDRCLKLVG